MMHTIDDHPSRATADLEFRGHLTQHAEVRTRVLPGDGHTVPVLCVEFVMGNQNATPMHAERVFGPGEYAQAEHTAKLLRRGRCITVQAPRGGIKLVVNNAKSIDLDLESEEQTPTPDVLRQGALL